MNPEPSNHAYLLWQTRTSRPLRGRDLGFAVKPFAYGRDPLCLLAVSLYALNRWLLKPALDVPFLHHHFNDLLLIPAALPLVLWVQRLLKWRTHDHYPDWKEIGFHLIIWGIIAEIVGPQFVDHVTGDWRDLVAYTVGAALTGLWWKRATKSSA